MSIHLILHHYTHIFFPFQIDTFTSKNSKLFHISHFIHRNLGYSFLISWRRSRDDMSACSFASVVSNSLQPMDCGLPGSYVHGDFPARIMEWVVMPSSKGSSQPRDWNCCSCISCFEGRHFTPKPLGKPLGMTTSYLLLDQVLAMSTISFIFSKSRWFPLITLGSYNNTSKLKRNSNL